MSIKNKKLVIFGIGKIADIAHYYFKNDTNIDVAAFTLDSDYIDKDNFNHLPIVPFEKLKKKFHPDNYDIFIALSYTNINQLREQKFIQSKDMGYSFASYISTKAYIAKNAVIGTNCMVLEDNTIQPFVKIFNNVTLWSGNHIGHHAVIKDNVFISSQVVISGNVTVKENTFIGVNSTIRDGVSIGKSNVIGAGSLILNNTEDDGIYMEKGTERSKVPSYKLKKI